MNLYRRTMHPWPGLEGWARQVELSHPSLPLFLYDTGMQDTATRTAQMAEPVVLLHGLGDEADTWRHLLPWLADHSRVIAPDLPGFGRSGKPVQPYRVPFFVETMLGLLDELEIERATWVGHSMGAVIAQTIALELSQRVERLVLISGGLFVRPQSLDLGTLLFLVPGLGEGLYNRLRKDPQAAYRTLYPYYANLDRLPDADRNLLFQRVNERVWSDEQRRAFLSALRNLAGWLPARQRQFIAQLAELETPTTLIWGAQDRINPVENAQTFLKINPSARLVILPEAGHNVHQEKPEEVGESISNQYTESSIQ